MGSSHPVLVFHPEHTASDFNTKGILKGYQINMIVLASGVEGSKHQERFDFRDSDCFLENGEMIMWRLSGEVF